MDDLRVLSVLRRTIYDACRPPQVGPDMADVQAQALQLAHRILDGLAGEGFTVVRDTETDLDVPAWVNGAPDGR